MSHSVVDDSEVVFDHQEEKAGFLEKEGLYGTKVIKNRGLQIRSLIEGRDLG